MAQRDYVGRGRSGAARRKTPSRKKRSSPKVSKTVVALAVAILVVFIGGLYFITHNKPDETPILPTHGTRPGNGLPPKPEERWRYIKELENRQIGVKSPTEPTAGGEVNSKTQLTDEQRQLLEQMQADMQQRPTQLSEVPYNDPSQLRNTGRQQAVQAPVQQQIAPPVQQQQQVTQPRNPFNNGAAQVQQHQQQPVQQQHQQPVQQQHQQPVQQPKPQVQQPKPQVVAPPVQTRQPETAAKPEVKQEVKTEAAKPETKPESKQKWMVQCGSFRAADQAESVRAQLAFEGVESRVTAGGGWNRVMLGPYSSRAAADKTLSRLKGIGMSSCIPLSVGG